MKKSTLIIACFFGLLAYISGYLHGHNDGYVNGHTDGIKIGIIKQMINEGYSLSYIEQEYGDVLKDDKVLNDIKLQL